MTPKISAVVSDVDGTLVTDDKILTPPAQAAVADLHARGIIFTIISSRPPCGLRMLLEPLGINTPVGGFNGGVIATPGLAVVSEHLLSPEVARRAVDRLGARGIQVWVFSGQDWLVRDPDGPYVRLEERTIGFRPTVVEDFGSALDAAAKIVGVSKNFDALEQCEHDVQATLDDSACVARSQPYYLDITHPLANKGVALAKLAKLLSVPLTEVAVVGDGRNDVAMFERSGLSIAMGNACPEVKQKADFVTDSNRENGFANAIERIILGGQRPDSEVDGAQQAVVAIRREGAVMTSRSEVKQEILADPEALSRRVADWLLELATSKQAAFAVALSGGSTPRRLYERLAGPSYREAFPWSRTHWFWGDERFVPHDDAQSNYRMVKEALLSRAPIPAGNIHPIPTEGVSPEAAAAAYERALKSFYGAERLDPARPLFDVNFLGLGPDGHTASLFPGTAVLAERDHWVAAVVGAKAEARITLTYPALESSRHAAFLVVGKEKRTIFDRFCRGDDTLPAAHLHPIGKLWIFADAAAGSSA